MARSDKEKKEIYDKWKKLINMSQEALNEWAKNPARTEASLNRERAKEEGGIQSGLDSLHRIKRRKSKPYKEWSDADFDNASQENGFNGRMLGGKIGQPVGSTGMSKWEISLRNWGHDPSLSSSPANSKYKAWKKTNKDAIAKSKAKKAKELIPYGRAKGMKPSDFNRKQIEMGKRVEMEHTKNPDIAQEISMDHLTEIPNYYTHLKKMEEQALKKASHVRVAYRFLMGDDKPKPTKPKLWDKMIQMAKGELSSVSEGGKTVNAPNDGKGFNKYPSAYANGWALAKYKELGGGWK